MPFPVDLQVPLCSSEAPEYTAWSEAAELPSLSLTPSSETLEASGSPRQITSTNPKLLILLMPSTATSPGRLRPCVGLKVARKILAAHGVHRVGAVLPSGTLHRSRGQKELREIAADSTWP
jgi:hypothetical protein